MPVVRSKSPRIEGGRCYPKLICWGDICRGTHWGSAKPPSCGGGTGTQGSTTLSPHSPSSFSHRPRCSVSLHSPSSFFPRPRCSVSPHLPSSFSPRPRCSVSLHSPSSFSPHPRCSVSPHLPSSFSPRPRCSVSPSSHVLDSSPPSSVLSPDILPFSVLSLADLIPYEVEPPPESLPTALSPGRGSRLLAPEPTLGTASKESIITQQPLCRRGLCTYPLTGVLNAAVHHPLHTQNMCVHHPLHTQNMGVHHPLHTQNMCKLSSTGTNHLLRSQKMDLHPLCATQRSIGTPVSASFGTGVLEHVANGTSNPHLIGGSNYNNTVWEYKGDSSASPWANQHRGVVTSGTADNECKDNILDGFSRNIVTSRSFSRDSRGISNGNVSCATFENSSHEIDVWDIDEHDTLSGHCDNHVFKGFNEHDLSGQWDSEVFKGCRQSSAHDAISYDGIGTLNSMSDVISCDGRGSLNSNSDVISCDGRGTLNSMSHVISCDGRETLNSNSDVISHSNWSIANDSIGDDTGVLNVLSRDDDVLSSIHPCVDNKTSGMTLDLSWCPETPNTEVPVNSGTRVFETPRIWNSLNLSSRSPEERYVSTEVPVNSDTRVFETPGIWNSLNLSSRSPEGCYVGTEVSRHNTGEFVDLNFSHRNERHKNSGHEVMSRKNALSNYACQVRNEKNATPVPTASVAAGATARAAVITPRRAVGERQTVSDPWAVSSDSLSLATDRRTVLVNGSASNDQMNLDAVVSLFTENHHIKSKASSPEHLVPWDGQQTLSACSRGINQGNPTHTLSVKSASEAKDSNDINKRPVGKVGCVGTNSATYSSNIGLLKPSANSSRVKRKCEMMGKDIVVNIDYSTNRLDNKNNTTVSATRDLSVAVTNNAEMQGDLIALRNIPGYSIGNTPGYHRAENTRDGENKENCQNDRKSVASQSISEKVGTGASEGGIDDCKKGHIGTLPMVAISDSTDGMCPRLWHSIHGTDKESSGTLPATDLPIVLSDLVRQKTFTVDNQCHILSHATNEVLGIIHVVALQQQQQQMKSQQQGQLHKRQLPRQRGGHQQGHEQQKYQQQQQQCHQSKSVPIHGVTNSLLSVTNTKHGGLQVDGIYTQKVDGLPRKVDRISAQKADGVSHKVDRIPVPKTDNVFHKVDRTPVPKTDNVSPKLNRTSVAKADGVSHKVDSIPVPKTDNETHKVDRTSVAKADYVTHKVDRTSVAKADDVTHRVDRIYVAKTDNVTHKVDRISVAKVDDVTHKVERVSIPKAKMGIAKQLRTIGVSVLPRTSIIKANNLIKANNSKAVVNKNEINKGQRGSGNTNNNNNNSKRSGAPYSRGSTSSDDQAKELHKKLHKEETPQLQPGSGGRSSRKAMKIGAKEDSASKTLRTPNLNTPLSRTRSGSRSSGGSSPAVLHGRAPHKTAVVTPAPAKFTPKTSSLNRFGFRNGGRATSGDSTDSVNSILSDAQTISDSNSNIFDLCDNENDNNKRTNRNSDAACDNSCVRSKRLETTESPAATTPGVLNVPKQTGGVQSNRITAFTRQLPKPQVITVKSVNPKSSSPACNSPKTHSPLSHVSSSKTKSPSIKSLLHAPLKGSADPSPSVGQQAANAGAPRAPRVSRDSESSAKSCVEPDSGLGSSSESDKVRGEGETDPGLDSSHVDSTEDMSDAWLKKTRNQHQQGGGSSSSKKKSSRGSMEIQFNGTSSFEVKKQSLEVGGEKNAELSPVPASQSPQEKQLEASKEKRDCVITYGMARQKFAPYSRSRYGYGYQTGQSRIGASATSLGSGGGTGFPSPGITKIPGNSGLVRSRVAMIETPQTKKTQQQPTPVLRRSNLKKPLVRPTSLEKTPILVMPVTEKTVELSKPVCRKLEYSENTTPPKGDAQRDSWESDFQEGKDPIHLSQPVVGDILIVGSVEVETQKDSNMMLEVDNYGSFYENLYDRAPVIDRNDVAFKGNPDFGIRVSEGKARKDVSENEKPAREKTGVSKDRTALDAQGVVDACKSPEIAEQAENGETEKAVPETPDDSGIKLLSPQSESSFEILESLSETTDLTAEEEDAKRGSCPNSVTDGEADVVCEVPSAVPEVERELLSSTLKEEEEEEASAVAPTDETPKPSLKLKPKLLPKSAERVETSNDAAETERSLDIPAAKCKNGIVAAADRRRSPSVATLPSCKSSSSDLRSSLESSVESHKSVGVTSAMTDSGELSNLSGKCTPTLHNNRSDLDQDFLIDDEIADQPGLMFGGGSTMASSFFGDDGIFDDIASSPPSHSQLKQVIAGSSRSRVNSVDTASSVGGDDLMLDYFDLEDAKAGTYDEEVLSPDASEIFSEWTAMMAEVSGNVSERCVSREGSTGGGRTSRPRLSSSSELSSPDPRRPTVLRPPRQGGVTEVEGSNGGVFVDRTSYHYMCQDVTSLKTMLLRLRRVLQAADTINPFDANLRNSLYLSLASSDSPVCSPGGMNGDKDTLTPSVNELSQENVDLRRQVVLLQQQLEERDRTIRLLQHQLAQNIESGQQVGGRTPPEAAAEAPINVTNAATQTDRSSRSGTLTGSSLSRTASIDDGLGPTVSSEVECNHKGRGRSTSAPDHRQPRAASQPPGQFVR